MDLTTLIPRLQATAEAQNIVHQCFTQDNGLQQAEAWLAQLATNTTLNPQQQIDAALVAWAITEKKRQIVDQEKLAQLAQFNQTHTGNLTLASGETYTREDIENIIAKVEILREQYDPQAKSDLVGFVEGLHANYEQANKPKKYQWVWNILVGMVLMLLLSSIFGWAFGGSANASNKSTEVINPESTIVPVELEYDARDWSLHWVNIDGTHIDVNSGLDFRWIGIQDFQYNDASYRLVVDLGSGPNGGVHQVAGYATPEGMLPN